jgi:hypothetical protein
MKASGLNRARFVASVVVAALGVGAMVGFVVHAGPAHVAEVLVRMRWAVAMAVALEGVRVVSETCGARALYGPGVPRGALVRAQLAGYALCYVLPAGRAVAEACKAAMLSPHLPRARVVGVALANQAMALVAVGMASSLCAVLAHTRLAGPLATVLVAHSAVTLGAGLVLLVTAARRMPPTGKGAALLAMLGSRVAQAAALLVLQRAAAPHADLLDGLTVWGLHLMGASVGDLALAQVGFTDGALVLGAAAAQLDAASALSVALAVRAAQMAWVGVGVAVGACGASPRRGTLVVLAKAASGASSEGSLPCPVCPALPQVRLSSSRASL